MTIGQRMLTEDSESRLDLVPIHKSADAPLQYGYNLTESVRLSDAHGEEIVRDLFTDTHVSSQVLFGIDSSLTCC